MAITEDDVRRWLRPEEPDYVAAAAALGQPAAAVLVGLAHDADDFFVARVVSLAGTIGGECARQVLDATRQHRSPVVRTQVAAAARSLPASAITPIVLPLLGDDDTSVRKFAVAAAAGASGEGSAALRDALERMRTTDPEAFLRDRATEVLRTR